MYDNEVIEPFTFVMMDNHAWMRIIPDEEIVGRWHIEFSREQKGVADRIVMYEEHVDVETVFAFVPWNYAYVVGSLEDSFFHYLSSDTDWIADEIAKATEALNDDAQDFNHDGSVSTARLLHKLSVVGHTLALTRAAGRELFENRSTNEDMERFNRDCAIEMREHRANLEARKVQ